MIWINVKEKLPKNDDDVLIFNPKDGITIGQFNKDEVGPYNGGWDNQYDWAAYMDPTHWMPLPEVPDEKTIKSYARVLPDYPLSMKSTQYPEG